MTYIASVNAFVGVSQEDVLGALKVETVGSNVTDIAESSNELLGLVAGDLITMTVMPIGKKEKENEYTFILSRSCGHCTPK